MEKENKFKIESESFENNQGIPKKYTCSGENINPSILILNTPKETKSFALIVDDPDTPRGNWLHWLVWNIPADINRIEENSLPKGSIEGHNDFGNTKYDGPCPPSGTHRYFFKLYALNKTLNLDKNTKKSELESAIKDFILSKAELVGLYSR